MTHRSATVELPSCSCKLYDEAFHDRTVDRVANALKRSLEGAQPITHLGVGHALVEKVASNRRVMYPDGRIAFGRGSRSGADKCHRDAPEGLIDPYLKTISFWNDNRPLMALHAYATHPMSYYGRGEVSSDFVGLARERRQLDDLSVKQIYVSGCSGDVTAGKYNDGSQVNRLVLVDRLHHAMVKAWKQTERLALEQVTFRNTQLSLDFCSHLDLTEEVLANVLRDDGRRVEDRILAAMGLSSRRRVASEQAIDLPCIDFGRAQIVLFPGESFVGYQLMAQRMRPDSFVVSVGYGECWPGYIPTATAFNDKFHDKWLWVAPGAEVRIHAALKQVLCYSDD